MKRTNSDRRVGCDDIRARSVQRHALAINKFNFIIDVARLETSKSRSCLDTALLITVVLATEDKTVSSRQRHNSVL